MSTDINTAGGAAETRIPSPTAEPATAAHVFFTCRRCRTKLFDAAEPVPHDPGDGARKSFKYRRGGPQTEVGELVASTGPSTTGGAEETCTSYFLDPDQSPWVAEDIREANASGAVVEPDTIYCPNPRCRAKLGTQSWTGSQCSCGAWIAPAFRIHARAVDKMKEFATS